MRSSREASSGLSPAPNQGPRGGHGYLDLVSPPNSPTIADELFGAVNMYTDRIRSLDATEIVVNYAAELTLRAKSTTIACSA